MKFESLGFSILVIYPVPPSDIKTFLHKERRSIEYAYTFVLFAAVRILSSKIKINTLFQNGSKTVPFDTPQTFSTVHIQMHELISGVTPPRPLLGGWERNLLMGSGAPAGRCGQRP